MGSGQTVAGKTAAGEEEGSAGAELVSAGAIRAAGRTVGAKAGADVTQGAGKEQGAARCKEIQQPARANAGGGRRSTLGAGQCNKTEERGDCGLQVPGAKSGRVQTRLPRRSSVQADPGETHLLL